jgi:hypothetical protein
MKQRDRMNQMRTILMTGLSARVTVAAFLFFLSACSADSSLIKGEILRALPDAKNGSIAIDLSKLSKLKVSKLCLQYPYTPQKSFQERVKLQIEDYSEIGDEYFVLWMFHDYAVPTQIKFHRWNEINFSERLTSGCVESQFVYLIDSQLSLTLN